ncbi:hypothetical protein M885DRAFT_157989 [Pelagophyceae sp. CCMP2097]|nr:hypothetical protein M885DRAFT_157989 [Pelagophyceae sp. CCMP2097]
MRVVACVAALLAPAFGLQASPASAKRLGPRSAVADLLRGIKVDIPWLAEGTANPEKKVNVPPSVARVLAQPHAPKRIAETAERTERVRACVSQPRQAERRRAGSQARARGGRRGEARLRRRRRHERVVARRAHGAALGGSTAARHHRGRRSRGAGDCCRMPC